MAEAITKTVQTLEWKARVTSLNLGTNINWLLPVLGSECAPPLHSPTPSGGRSRADLPLKRVVVQCLQKEKALFPLTVTSTVGIVPLPLWENSDFFLRRK